jgi:hypothetical protein
LTVRIVPHAVDWTPAVRQFNARIVGHGLPVPFEFPASPVSEWLPPRPDRTVYQEMFLAVEDDVVRGGYILKHQEVWHDGRSHAVANLQLPLSEGIVDPKFRFLGVQLVRDALKRQPRLYSLGMGGLHNPYPRLLKGLGWSLSLVPFLFRMEHPARVLRELPLLRASRVRRMAADALVFSGAAFVGTKLADGWARIRRRSPDRTPSACRVVQNLGQGVDTVWELARDDYQLSAVRDLTTVTALHDRSVFGNLHFLELEQDGAPLGWVVIGDSRMHGHRHFGNLRVGSVIDGFARPWNVPALVAAGVRFLRERGVDLVVSNQTHGAWIDALQGLGFRHGPSNFALARSREFAALTGPEADSRSFHFNRGDGDGPINL